MWLRRKVPDQLSVEDRACLEAKGEAQRRLGEPTFAPEFLAAFLCGDIPSAFDIGQPDTRWLRGLALSLDERVPLLARASEAYFKCFAVAVMEDPANQRLWGELTEAANIVDEKFAGLPDDGRRRMAVGLWQGARMQGKTIREMQAEFRAMDD